MTDMTVAGAGLAVVGLAAAIVAKPLGTSQERIVTVLPEPLQRFYRIVGAGAPFDSPPWVAYNRIAGLLIALLGTMIVVFDAIRS